MLIAAGGRLPQVGASGLVRAARARLLEMALARPWLVGNVGLGHDGPAQAE